MVDPDDHDRHAPIQAYGSRSPWLGRRTGRGTGVDRACGRRPALLVVAEDLQLDGEVDLAHLDRPAAPTSTTGAKLRMLVTPAATRRSAASWAAAAGVAMTPMLTRLRLHDLGQFVDVANTHAAEHRADLGGVDVDDAGHGEAPLAEPAVAGERLAEVAGADDDDGPVVGEAELAADLVHEVRDLVADAAGAVAAEVAQVLADLGGVHAGELGEALGRDRSTLFVGLLGEDPQVHRQTGDGGFGDAAARAFGRHTRCTLGTRAHVHKAGPATRRRTSVTPGAGTATPATLWPALCPWLRRRATQELAADVARQLVDEEDLRRALVAGEVVACTTR